MMFLLSLLKLNLIYSKINIAIILNIGLSYVIIFFILKTNIHSHERGEEMKFENFEVEEMYYELHRKYVILHSIPIDKNKLFTYEDLELNVK